MSEIPEKKDSVTYIGSNLPGGMGEDYICIGDYSKDCWFNPTTNFYDAYLDTNIGESTAAVTFGNNHSTTFSSQSFNLNKTQQNVNLTTSQKSSQEQFWKFGEGETLKAVNDYIVSTYHSHYASEKSKVQVLDMIDAIGDGVPFCRDNLIKYSSRFGKKDGMSRLDALKIIHYGVLLYHFAGFNNETAKSNYETF